MSDVTGGIDLGPYRLRSQVDKGEFCSVYRATHEFLGTTHAIKVLNRGQEKALADALCLEARLQSSLVHPSIVRVTDGGVWHDRPYVVADWVDGPTLESSLSEGPMSVGVSIKLFRMIVRGVQAIHNNLIVHRDLSSSNILLRAEGPAILPLITDFGLAKRLVQNAAPVAEGLSMEFSVLGTPEYMAPEQASNPGLVDRRADLWSLGVILYELLSGELPFEGTENTPVFVASRLGRFRPIEELRPETPEPLRQLVADLLKPNPAHRVQDARSILVRMDVLGA